LIEVPLWSNGDQTRTSILLEFRRGVDKRASDCVYSVDVREGAQVVFEEFAAARLDPLFRFASVLTGDRALAEDVVQDVLIRVHERWDQLSSVQHLDAYVRRMVVNEYLSWRRRWARVVPVEFVPDPGEPDFATAHADRDGLVTDLAKLPRRQRAAVVLRFYEGLSDDEAADVMGCSPSTVRSHLSRALHTLRVSRTEHPVATTKGDL